MEIMRIDWLILVLLIIGVIALLFFLIKNTKEINKDLVKKLNEDYKKRDKTQSEVNDLI